MNDGWHHLYKQASNCILVATHLLMKSRHSLEMTEFQLSQLLSYDHQNHEGYLQQDE